MLDFAPKPPELLVSSRELKMRVPDPACSSNEASKLELLPTDCLLAQEAADIVIYPPVTERQGQVQTARIQEVVMEYASYSQVITACCCTAFKLEALCSFLSAQPCKTSCI